MRKNLGSLKKQFVKDLSSSFMEIMFPPASFTSLGVFLLLHTNRPRPDVPEGRLPPTKPVSIQSPSEGKEECGGERH